MAAFEARMQVLELGRQPVIQFGELVAETEMSGKLAGRVKKA